jgi:hypothetical protein
VKGVKKKRIYNERKKGKRGRESTEIERKRGRGGGSPMS